MKATNLFLLSVMVSQLSAYAAETDTFTRRHDPLDDAAVIINEKANRDINKTISKLNSTDVGCDEELLYEELRNYFGNHINGELIVEILNDKDVPKRYVDLKESVYKNWKPWDGLGMGLDFLKKSNVTASPVVKIGDVLIGTDKFEHFFGQGFSYFTNNYLKEKGAIKAVKVGVAKEKTYLGGNKFGNGVFSYGDLSANFNGMRFWNHILQLRNDVLGKEHNMGPYIACSDKKWVQVKMLDFRDYMDESMDEAINCSKFPSESTAKRFSKTLKDSGFQCPLSQDTLDELVLKYGKMAKWIINEDGVGAVKYFSEFKDD